ncbi:MAG: Polypeptide-transport-associated domain protein FtsQ-type [Myxococcales bacterium]|nr:Polypeptide-transport-associated domain protein FtsQ-type [Myxococcales bacterium]
MWSRLPRPRVIADACGRAARRALPAAAAVAALAAISGTAWAGYRFVTTSSRFAITEITVRGSHRLSDEQVRQALPIHLGDNVFATNLDRLVTGLRANPWIVGAEAHRILPHTIEIVIRERTASAIADVGGLYLVDVTGHPFKRVELAADDGSGLPIVTGLDRSAYLANPEATAALVRGALGALSTWRSETSRPAIGEVHLDPRGALTLHTYEQSTAIQLGAIDAELPTRMQTFDAAWNELSTAERARARAIHLDTRPDHVTVAFARN